MNDSIESQLLKHAQQEAQEKQRTESQRENQRTQSQGRAGKTSGAIHARRLHYEVPVVNGKPAEPVSMEAKLRSIEIEDRITRDRSNRSGFHNVRAVEKRFASPDDIKDFKSEAWHRLLNSQEGKALIRQAGGRDHMVRMMDRYRGDFLTKTATLCEQGGLDSTATGRTVHRMAELYTLEKQPKDILRGTRQVEHRIDYTDNQGKARHVEIDDITKRGERTFIRDYKPVNLANFERTTVGREWSNWMEKNIGANYRERIQAGENPFFIQQTKDSKLPTHLRHALRDYIREVNNHHIEQLEHYRDLYSQANSIDHSNINISVRPYFKYSY